jgi:putative transposase
MELWHALNRGVERRDIFLDSGDYARFVHNLYEFNDTMSATAFHHRAQVGPHRSDLRERLVDVHGWCLMKNHYHLLLSERVEHGITKFLMKLNVGYAKYFNERYGRSGTLFQGRTKKVHIERDAHFNYILHYIHLNPLDYLEGAQEWRERSHSRIKDARRAFEHLAGYRWSSYLDYAGEKNFPSILTKTLFSNALGDYSDALHSYVARAEIGTESSLILE